MLSIPWGRSLATPSPPVGLVGDDVIPQAAQPPGLIPGTLATCPTACTPRPRNLVEYQAACAAAEGDPVGEFDASEIVPGMVAWHCGHFLTVAAAEHKCIGDITGPLADSEARRAQPFVELRLREPDVTGWLLADPGSPVYCLI